MNQELQMPLGTLLVVPVYNHAAGLPKVVAAAMETGLPVLVVDDGSTDDGIEKIRDMRCSILRLGENEGKGAAILAGARLAQKQGYQAIATVDADGQLQPSEVLLLLEKAKDHWPALVIGARRMPSEATPVASRFGRAFSNFWVRLESGLDLPDTQSGLRLYPLDQLLRLPLKCKRYDFEVEVIVKSAWAGLPVLSTPVSVHYPAARDRVSHFHQFKDNLRLTLLHSRLVFRALMPIGHNRIMPPKEVPVGHEAVFHPIRLLKRLCTEHSSALQLATAIWLGFFMGALPLIAVHTIAIIYVARRLHLNVIAAVGASQFCCPPLVPLLCIQLGYFFRNGEWLTDLTWRTVVQEMHLRLWEWLIGSLLVGPLLGFIGAALSFAMIRNWRRQRLNAECPIE